MLLWGHQVGEHLLNHDLWEISADSISSIHSNSNSNGNAMAVAMVLPGSVSILHLVND